MSSNLYAILSTLFDVSDPVISSQVRRVDYVGYAKTLSEGGKHYLTYYDDVYGKEISFGISDEAITFQDDYAYIYVRSVYRIDTTYHPHWSESVQLRIVLCSFRGDIEGHSRAFLNAFLTRFSRVRSVLTSVQAITFVEMGLNKEQIYTEETNHSLKEMLSNNLLHFATYDFKLTYTYVNC